MAAPTSSTASSTTAIPATGRYDKCKYVKHLIVLFYHMAYMAPSECEVELKDGWLVFGGNKEFYEFTGFPEPGRSCLRIEDAETREFIPILTTGGVPGDLTENPWIIVRRRELQDDECLLLATSIDSLLEARNTAQHFFGGEKVDYSLTREGSETDVSNASAMAVDGSNMIIINDDDDDDPDYEPSQSDEEGGSNSSMETETESMEDESEEEEAAETETDGEEVQVIIDLTWMSD